MTRILLSCRLWLGLLAAYWLLLFTGTHLPSDLPLLDGSIFDKVLHFIAYAGLAMLVALVARAYWGRLSVATLVSIAAALAVYGAIDELLQPPFGRHCSIYDWFADVGGIVTSLTIYATTLNRWALRKVLRGEGSLSDSCRVEAYSNQ